MLPGAHQADPVTLLDVVRSRRAVVSGGTRHAVRAHDAEPVRLNQGCAQLGKPRLEGCLCRRRVRPGTDPADAAALLYVTRTRVALVPRLAPDAALALVAQPLRLKERCAHLG